MGLDEDGNLLITPRGFNKDAPEGKGAAAVVAVTHPPVGDGKGQNFVSSDVKLARAIERKKSNVDAKLQEMDSLVAARLIESPYNSKVNEKYPINVTNGPLSPSARKQSVTSPTPQQEQQQQERPERQQGQQELLLSPKQRPSSSPSKRSESTSSPQTRQNNNYSPKKQSARPYSSPSHSHSDAGRETSLGSAHASDPDFALSAFRYQGSSMAGIFGALPLTDPASPIVGGAVKSSFLTELGLLDSSAVPVENDVYQPPDDVRPSVLVSTLTRKKTVYLLLLLSILIADLVVPVIFLSGSLLLFFNLCMFLAHGTCSRRENGRNTPSDSL